MACAPEVCVPIVEVCLILKRTDLNIPLGIRKFLPKAYGASHRNPILALGRRSASRFRTAHGFPSFGAVFYGFAQK